MIKRIKKGFTLVELLVVIAILAVLATVSILGYSSFTKKANYSNDTTLVSEWNILLDGKDVLAESNSNDKLNNVNEVKEFFKDNGTGKDTFMPKTSGYHFYWSSVDNNVYLVEDAINFTVSYPEANASVTEANSYRLDLEYCLINTTIAGVTLSRNAIEIGKETEVTLTGTNATSIIVNDVTKYLVNNKIKLQPLNSDAITIKQDPTVYITNVAVAPTNINIGVDHCETLVPTITPNDATIKTLSWTSSNETVATVDANGKVTAIAVGTATITVSSTDAIEEANNKKGVCVVTVVKNDPTVTNPTAILNLVYTGNSLNLVNAGSTDGGTLQYKINDGEYSATLPSATDAGTYTIYYKVVGNEKFEDVAEDHLTVTIAKADYDMSNAAWSYTSPYIFDNSEKTIEVNNLPSGVTVKQYTDNSKTNAGDYTAKVEFNYDTNNYNEPTLSNIDWKINKADATIDTTNVTKTYTYTGSAQTVNSGATLNHSETTLAYTNNTFTNVPSTGKQTVTISAEATTNYNEASTTVEITINKATQTISAPTSASIGITTITLNANATGHGDTYYGYHTANNASNVDNWSTSLEITGLSANTTYYFFAKYTGDSNYNESISTGAEIKTNPNTYTITYNKNDGNWVSEYTASETYTYGVGLSLPTSANIEKNGYTFDGWFESDTFSGDAITSISTTDTGNKTYYAKWNENYKALAEMPGGSLVKYYPILGGTNPIPDVFAYSTNGIDFTEIPRSGSYTYNDIKAYADAGTLYYKGGSVVAIRTIDKVSWEDVFGQHSPTYNATPNDITDSIKAQLLSGDSIFLLEFNGAAINGVNIKHIFYDEYKSCFSGIEDFWSNALYSSGALYYNIYIDWQYSDATGKKSIIITRTFN